MCISNKLSGDAAAAGPAPRSQACDWGVSVGLGRSPTDLGTIPSSNACKLCDLGHVSLPP